MTQNQNQNIASQTWTITKGRNKGMQVTVSLDMEYYDEFSFEYNVRVHQKQIVQNGTRFESTMYDSVQSFDSKKRGVETYNFELSARGCPDYDAKRIAIFETGYFSDNETIGSE